ncbi:hypothetical protein FQB35_02610 [Crassaminicella thermophila]|uniref:ABC-2 type transport system permease protein n=1 Tax=Crassaminicella thermophila TaxID=2599308 RepID=A0A5C0SB79_CRATE|nr:hypothetical protein [Crassaminicella thermophila]QEK11350.1 hypothetical protein FQB35_02610 [Crassaminicella thermophila]
MKLTTLYFNKSIIREDLKRFWGMGVLYFLVLVFTGPIIFLINVEDVNKINSVIEAYFNIYKHGFQLIFAVIFPIILATLIFRYMQVKNSTGMIHSFPFTRNILFNSHLLSNLIILSIPVFVNFIIMFFVYKGVYTGTNIVIGDIYKWLFTVLLLNYTVLFMTVFTGMISGVSFIQAILSLIFLFLPLGLTGLVLIALDSILFGFVPNNTIIKNFALKVIPITNELYREGNSLLIAWYIALLVILFLVSKYLYNKRHLESAGDSIAFDILKPLFKYGMAFCTMILGGLYFSVIVANSSFWLYFGFFIGGLFGYIIAEMIIEKSIWVFNKLRGFIPFIIIAGLFFTVIDLDLIGYEKRVPNLNEIKAVYFAEDYYIDENVINKDDKLIHEKSNIAAVRNLHKMIIDNKSKIQNTPNRKNIAIGYKLKNGKILIREYDVPKNIINSSPYIKEIYESQEYKKIKNDIFRIDANKAHIIEIHTRSKDKEEYFDKEIVISDRDEIKEVINLIKKDILNESYEEMSFDFKNLGIDEKIFANITIECERESGEDKRKSIYFYLRDSYKLTKSWLEEKGYL